MFTQKLINDIFSLKKINAFSAKGLLQKTTH